MRTFQGRVAAATAHRAHAERLIAAGCQALLLQQARRVRAAARPEAGT